MVFEDGVEWLPLEPEKRGKHATFESALDAAFGELTAEKNEFFDSLADVWGELFPELPVKPGRYENGKIYLYVKNAPLSFMVRPKLPFIKHKLSELPGAPKRISLWLEIHAT